MMKVMQRKEAESKDTPSSFEQEKVTADVPEKLNPVKFVQKKAVKEKQLKIATMPNKNKYLHDKINCSQGGKNKKHHKLEKYNKIYQKVRKLMKVKTCVPGDKIDPVKQEETCKENRLKILAMLKNNEGLLSFIFDCHLTKKKEHHELEKYNKIYQKGRKQVKVKTGVPGDKLDPVKREETLEEQWLKIMPMLKDDGRLLTFILFTHSMEEKERSILRNRCIVYRKK